MPLLGGLIAAVWVASGPLVRRVRSLTVARAAVGRDALRGAGAEKRATTKSPSSRAPSTTPAPRYASHLATLERRDRTLREFLANTTHDVMIPLTVLQGHLSALQKSPWTRPSRWTRRVLVAALKEAQYMSSLLHNLGAAAKLEAPEQFMQRHPVDLNALVDRVVERHRPGGASRGRRARVRRPRASNRHRR